MPTECLHEYIIDPGDFDAKVENCPHCNRAVNFSYDTRCAELADVFLSEEAPATMPNDMYAGHVQRLAQEIQDCIELFTQYDDHWKNHLSGPKAGSPDDLDCFSDPDPDAENRSVTMSDLIERLRETAGTCKKRDPFEAHVQQKLEQAADEIERLTAEVSVLRKNLVQAYVDNGCYLDEALEIAGLDVCPDGVDAPASDNQERNDE